MGHSNLTWDTNQLEGCFKGKQTFDPSMGYESNSPVVRGEVIGVGATPEFLELPSDSKLVQYNLSPSTNNNVAGKRAKQPLTPLTPPIIKAKVKRVEYYYLGGNGDTPFKNDNSDNDYIGGGRFQVVSPGEKGNASQKTILQPLDPQKSSSGGRRSHDNGGGAKGMTYQTSNSSYGKF